MYKVTHVNDTNPVYPTYSAVCGSKRIVVAYDYDTNTYYDKWSGARMVRHGYNNGVTIGFSYC